MTISEQARALRTSVRRPSVATNVALKVTLLVAIAYMFLFPDQPQFEGKSMTLRAVVYPVLSFTPAVVYVWRRLDSAYPTLADLSFTFTYTFDIVGNDLGLYTNFHYFQYVVHFVNSIPFVFVLMTVVLALETVGAIRLGFWGAVVFALALLTAGHAAWEGFEHVMDRFFGADLQPGGMNEAFEDSAWAFVGSLVGVATVWWWERRAWFTTHFVHPLAAYLEALLPLARPEPAR